jgi:eukaryotic-like serine/threonine-protein kinase
VSSSGSHAGWSEVGADEPVPQGPALDLPDEERYERIDLLGVGGMGRVFEAWDNRLQRRVALKEVAPHLFGSHGAQRLAAEAMLTADLEHPGIVSVHDAGRTDDGRLFYTMRLVRGSSLAERLLDPDGSGGRVALLRHLLDACHAVGYAHRRGIVHRDLKPANIMIGEFGETQVVDWGLARRLQDGEVDASSAGTEGYMSPEASSGRSTDARSDVWSLGATLREVVGGELPPDLGAVIARALHPEPEARYPDAHDLAVDLEHYLDGRRVDAYDYSPLELVKRLAQAWRAPLAVGAVACLVVFVVATASWVRTGQARNRAVEAERQTRAALERSDLHLASSLEAQAASALRDGRFPAAQVLASYALLHGESPVARGVLVAGASAGRPAAIEATPLPDCEAVRLADDEVLCETASGLALHDGGGAPRWTIDGTVHQVRAVGDLVAVTRPGFVMELRRRSDGELLSTHEGMPGGYGLAANPAERVVGAANGSMMSVLSLPGLERWDAEPCGPDGSATALALGDGRAFVACWDSRIVALERGHAPRSLLRFDADHPEARILAWDEGVLLAGTPKGVVMAIDPDDGAVLGSVHALDGPVDHLEPLPGTSLVAIAGDRGGVRLWDLDAQVEVMRLPAPTRAVRATESGRLLVAGAELRSWALPDRLRPLRFEATAGFAAVASSPDGRFIAGAGGDGALTVWSSVDGRVVAERRWQERVVKHVAFTPDGERLMAAGLGEDGVRTWRTDDWTDAGIHRGGIFRRIGALSDGRIWGFSYGRTLHLDLGGTAEVFAADATLIDGVTSHDGGEMVALSERGRVWRLRSGEAAPEALLDLPGARAIALDAAGRIALAREDHVELFDAVGRPVGALEAAAGGVLAVALSPDGRWAAAGLLDGSALLWSVVDRRLVAVLAGHRERVASLHFSSDGGSLVTGDWAGVVRRWSVPAAERPAAELVAEVEAAWRMPLDQALAAGL